MDYTDETGDAFEEYIVYHPKFVEWMRINGIEVKQDYTQEEIDDLVKRSPYYKATANDVDWLEKVRMQGRVQKWVDHSISVTINLPADVSEELVANLYLEAWKCGCKGCTVYRDGCRSGVLVAMEKKPEPQAQTLVPHAHKRPAELEADVVRFQNNKEKWIAFVGLMDGKPYEIFTGLADDEDGIFCPKSVTRGKIIRAVDENGVKRYDFQFINKRGYKTTIEGLSDKFNPEYWNYATACPSTRFSNLSADSSSTPRASTHGRWAWNAPSNAICPTAPRHPGRSVPTAATRPSYIRKAA